MALLAASLQADDCWRSGENADCFWLGLLHHRPVYVGSLCHASVSRLTRRSCCGHHGSGMGLGEYFDLVDRLTYLVGSSVYFEFEWVFSHR